MKGREAKFNLISVQDDLMLYQFKLLQIYVILIQNIY